MKTQHTFHLLDVFGETRYTGNQLATFLNAASLSDGDMQRIAREINFSETTFIPTAEERNGGFDARIFTPVSEVDFAGHPTLGTAWIIRERILARPVEEVVLNLKVGQVPVRFAPDGIPWMRQVQPVFGNEIPGDRLAAVLGLDRADLDPRLPVEEISTGLPCLIVPVKTREALRRIRIDRCAYDALTADTWAKVLLAFCPGGYAADQAFSVRVFPVALGIAEDPATGSGNGCLGAYLVKHRAGGDGPVRVHVGQGYEIGRPSVIHLRADKEGDRYALEVGGRVLPVATGVWG